MENTTGNKLNVLLADDDLDDSYIFNAAVESCPKPINLSIAEDGQKVLAYLNSNPLPDVIFLDINMPLKNGLECLGEIRANNRFKKVPVVMYSTTNNRLNVEASYKGGANLYVVKPNTFEGVGKMVEVICNKEWVENVSTLPKEKFLINTF